MRRELPAEAAQLPRFAVNMIIGDLLLRGCGSESKSESLESKSESLESLESDAHVLALEKPESFNMGLTEPSESELDPFRSRSAPDEAPSI